MQETLGIPNDTKDSRRVQEPGRLDAKRLRTRPTPRPGFRPSSPDDLLPCGARLMIAISSSRAQTSSCPRCAFLRPTSK